MVDCGAPSVCIRRWKHPPAMKAGHRHSMIAKYFAGIRNAALLKFVPPHADPANARTCVSLDRLSQSPLEAIGRLIDRKIGGVCHSASERSEVAFVVA